MANHHVNCPFCKALVAASATGRADARCGSCGKSWRLPPLAVNVETGWYFVDDKTKVGPVSWKDLQGRAQAGLFKPSTMIRQEGNQKWREARSVSGLFPTPAHSFSLKKKWAWLVGCAAAFLFAALLLRGQMSSQNGVHKPGPVSPQVVSKAGASEPSAPSPKRTSPTGAPAEKSAPLDRPVNGLAWEPNARDLDAAVNAGDLGGYHAKISNWLSQQVPAETKRISEEAMKALLNDPVFRNTLNQRQLLSKHGIDKINAFAQADPSNKTFLAWLLRSTKAMDLYLEAATPTHLAAREENKFALATGTLAIWKRIYQADPDSRQGIYLRLAIATALRPPGTGNRGAGMQKTPSDPVVRYTYFKSAHKNNELFPSFDNLTVWDYQHVVSSCASESDLTWARDMINTWHPDLRINEKVVLSTGQVWRRNSPWPYDNGFRSVMEGGGKCGPRSSWAVMICQAFGIPGIGVGQPAHACVAYKAADGWQVAYGRGWTVSKLEGMSGPDFLAGMEARAHAQVFSQVEHLRWLAATLVSKEQAAVVMGVANALAQSKPATKRDLTASEKAEEADADPGASSAPMTTPPKAKEASTAKPEAPVKPVPGVIHVKAAAFTRMGGAISYAGAQVAGVCVHDCFTGGKQVHFQAHMRSAWVDYVVDAPAAGTYGLEMRVAAANRDQVLDVRKLALPISSGKKAAASNTWRDLIDQLGPAFATDDNPNTRWASEDGGPMPVWLDVDLGKATAISKVVVDERDWNRVRKFQLQYKDGAAWKTILEGTTLGAEFTKEFSPVTARHVRLNILEATKAPTIWEFQLYAPSDKEVGTSITLPNTYGLWETTKAVDLELDKGKQIVRISTGHQRGVALRWFELKLK